ncbi:acyl-CoA dehydrogenase family protein [Thermomonospora amylolytica]|uniref:acyl-CoA dehydrogenase family protein n=1 Tax=Thermomonospora amylolytica TaxID=1411117 RepID=UPI002D77D8CC|nr:acyl-CoA dehydrogenase family protein [Thermomonospora amylolytica]
MGQAPALGGAAEGVAVVAHELQAGRGGGVGVELPAGVRRRDVAVEHTRARVQFGRPIGAFQAVKHACADMYVEVESARATAHHRDLLIAHIPTGAEGGRLAMRSRT